MTRIARISTVLAVSAVAALAAGCGNEEQNDYVDQVNAIQEEIASAATQASTTSPSNAKEAADQVRQLADAYAAGADDLAAIDPPDDVADLHEQLTDQISALAGDIDKAADTIEDGKPQEAAQALSEMEAALRESQTQFNSLIDEINAEFGN